MFLRTLLFLAALYLILYLLTKSLRAFFRHLASQRPQDKMPKPEEPTRLRINKKDIEDAEFEDISDDDNGK
jgi:hypothetical protein